MVYGIGAQRFSIMTGSSVPEAENILRKYFATYRGLDTYLREAADRAVSERQARTGSGRLVRFRYDEQDRQQISMTKRNGKNTPIQGTSADILKRALRLLKDELRGTNAQIVNIIHDEIVVEADADEAQDVALKVERAMCAAGRGIREDRAGESGNRDRGRVGEVRVQPPRRQEQKYPQITQIPQISKIDHHLHAPW